MCFPANTDSRVHYSRNEPSCGGCSAQMKEHQQNHSLSSSSSSNIHLYNARVRMFSQPLSNKETRHVTLARPRSKEWSWLRRSERLTTLVRMTLHNAFSRHKAGLSHWHATYDVCTIQYAHNHASLIMEGSYESVV
jgi:hypothetical protein